MKLLSRQKAIEKLKAEMSVFAHDVGNNYAHRAKDCSTCDVKGSCCTDEHFVNVRISPLEAAAIRTVLDTLPSEKRDRLNKRIEDTVSRYSLDKSDGIEATYSCPLLDDEMGCIVHGVAKPLPCILHGCYERQEDLPPSSVRSRQEKKIARLNLKVYGKQPVLRPLPVAILPSR